MAFAHAQFGGMDDKRLASRGSGRDWTQPDHYVASLARKRAARKSREPSPQSQHEASRFPVSMLPFVALMAVFAILVVATILVAFPGNQPELRAKRPSAPERGYAPKGWLQEAEKQFH